MSRDFNHQVAAAEKSFLAAKRRQGERGPDKHPGQRLPKSEKRPGYLKKDDVILKAMEANTAEFFAKTVLTDAVEARLLYIGLHEETPEGEKKKLSNNQIAVLKLAMAYKRGLPTIRVDKKTDESTRIIFEIEGMSQSDQFSGVPRIKEYLKKMNALGPATDSKELTVECNDYTQIHSENL